VGILERERDGEDDGGQQKQRCRKPLHPAKREHPLDVSFHGAPPHGSALAPPYATDPAFGRAQGSPIGFSVVFGVGAFVMQGIQRRAVVVGDN
jgi:hypothetical protein